MGLQQFERRLERLFEGVFARAFRSGLEPVELGRRLARQMDRGRQVTASGTVAPNHFTFLLSEGDHRRFASQIEFLREELETAAREHARDEGYRFVGRVEVELRVDPGLDSPRFELDAEVRAAPGGKPIGSLVLPDGRRFLLGDGAVTIGRVSACDVVLDHPTVSRSHATVERDGDGFAVRDLGSRNGTRVNGRPVGQAHLTDGDDVAVGAVVLRYEAV